MLPIKRARWSLILVNCLTFSRMLIGIYSVIAFYSDYLRKYLLLFLLYILISDLLDGALARRLAASTRAGGIFDYVVDRFNFYLAINILVHEGVPPLLFLPFLVRDLIYISVQAYVNLPTIRGTKAASFGATFSTYIYVLLLNYERARATAMEAVIFAGFVVSLANLLVRVGRHKDLLWNELKKDFSS